MRKLKGCLLFGKAIKLTLPSLKDQYVDACAHGSSFRKPHGFDYVSCWSSKVSGAGMISSRITGNLNFFANPSLLLSNKEGREGRQENGPHIYMHIVEQPMHLKIDFIGMQEFVSVQRFGEHYTCVTCSTATAFILLTALYALL